MTKGMVVVSRNKKEKADMGFLSWLLGEEQDGEDYAKMMRDKGYKAKYNKETNEVEIDQDEEHLSFMAKLFGRKPN